MSTLELCMVTLVVPDMEEGIEHYTRDWGFRLAKDARHASGHRWVEVRPGSGARLRLVEAHTDEQRSAIGRQAGGRIAFFLNIAPFEAGIAELARNGIEVLEPPRTEDYGRVAVLRDRFGNRWDVLDAEFEAAA